MQQSLTTRDLRYIIRQLDKDPKHKAMLSAKREGKEYISLVSKPILSKDSSTTAILSGLESIAEDETLVSDFRFRHQHAGEGHSHMTQAKRPQQKSDGSSKSSPKLSESKSEDDEWIDTEDLLKKIAKTVTNLNDKAAVSKNHRLFPIEDLEQGNFFKLHDILIDRPIRKEFESAFEGCLLEKYDLDDDQLEKLFVRFCQEFREVWTARSGNPRFGSRR